MTPATARRNVLLVHPLGMNWLPGEKDMSRVANIMPPLGLLSLAAWLERRGHAVRVHDCYAWPGQDEVIARALCDGPPDFIGFSATTSSFPDAARLARRIKQACPRVRTVCGGVHVSALGAELLRAHPQFDFGVAGEGEEALAALVESDGAGAAGTPGVLWRDGEEVRFAGPREPTLDLDCLPFPDYGKLAGFPRAYRLPLFNYPRAPGATAVTSRGCTYHCSYCDRSVFRRSYRRNSAGYVAELVRVLRARHGVRHVNFYDDNFALDRARLHACCEELIRARTGCTFNIAARAEHLHAADLPLLKRAGCWMISLGLESGDPELLRRHRSHSDPEQARQKVAEIRAAGIRAKGLFMLGLPGETEESIERTIEYALGLPLSDLNVAKFTPFPGSPLYREIRSHGSFDEDWERMNCLNFVFVPAGLTAARLEQRFREFYRRYYGRPAAFLAYGAMLWRSPDSWLRFLRNLSDFLALRRAYRRSG